MYKGTVKFFNEKSNFGFIIEDETKKEYFVHGTSVIGTIKETDRVEFNLKDDKRGPKAVDVKVIS